MEGRVFDLNGGPDGNPSEVAVLVRLVNLTFVLSSFALCFACQELHERPVDPFAVSTSSPEPPRPRWDTHVDAAIAGDTAADEMLTAAVKERRAEVCPEIEDAFVARFRDPLTWERGERGERATADRALTLYLMCPATDAPLVFELLEGGKTAIARAAWRVASARPSAEMRKKISRRLSDALQSGNLTPLLTAEVAQAVLENKLPDSYTFLRQALALSGKASFAKALITLEPTRASADAMEYLAKTSVEELRSQTPSQSPKTLDRATCNLILEYFLRHPPALSHPNFGHLFHYAVTHDAEIATRAQTLLAKIAGENAPDLAAALAKLALEVQLRYLAELGTSASGSFDLLRQELRRRTTYTEVVDVLDRQVTSR